MYCEKCGTQMENTSRFCPSCGAPVSNVAPNPYTQVPPYAPKKKSAVPLIIGIAAACFVLILGGFLMFHQMAKANLQKQLLRDWSRVESSSGTYYTLELDFSDDEIEYIFDSFYYDTTIAVMDYEVISGTQIRVDGRLHTIEFNDDKTMFTVYPAMTSSDSYEHWFHLE